MTLLVLALIAAALQVGLPLLVWARRDRIVFEPAATPRPEDGLAAFRDADARVVRVVRPDGRRLAAYDVRPHAAEPGAPVALFFHGNSGNLATRAETLARFARGVACRVLAVDYSGYGGNEGRPCEAELDADALAAYDHLVREGVAPSRIVVFGESLGGCPALRVASRRAVAGVVVQSTFSSLPSMALRRYPLLPLTACLVRSSFPNVARIATLRAPVLVVHGTRDRLVPFSEARRLHAAAPRGAELLAVDGADHGTVYDLGGEPYLRDLGARFRAWCAAASAAPAGALAVPASTATSARRSAASRGATVPRPRFHGSG